MTDRDYISFGNYLLSKERKAKVINDHYRNLSPGEIRFDFQPDLDTATESDIKNWRAIRENHGS